MITTHARPTQTDEHHGNSATIRSDKLQQKFLFLKESENSDRVGGICLLMRYVRCLVVGEVCERIIGLRCFAIAEWKSERSSDER